MKFKNFTKETVYELLTYLAENEDFSSLETLKSFSKKEVVEILKEIALGLKEEMNTEEVGARPSLSDTNLSPKTISVLSSLSPKEELLLFKTFKVV